MWCTGNFCPWSDDHEPASGVQLPIGEKFPVHHEPNLCKGIVSHPFPTTGKGTYKSVGKPLHPIPFLQQGKEHIKVWENLCIPSLPYNREGTYKSVGKPLHLIPSLQQGRNISQMTFLVDFQLLGSSLKVVICYLVPVPMKCYRMLRFFSKI